MKHALLLLLLLLALPATALQRQSGEPRPWEHESSDLAVDPRIRFGHLENGLRWAWARNAEPERRCYLRLHVDAGSFGERDRERGMAHFLEHMAFNGSEHFEAGTLVEWFQSHGMAFGADTNAHTGFSETVYKLDLPEADEGTLREGLTVLRDYAGGLLLEQEEIDAEKGVIDGEERERDSAGYRLGVRYMETVFAGTRPAERLIIGKKEVRDAFDAEGVRAFYRRWYRPENLTLVAVGDLGELDPVPLFEEYFGDLAVLEAAPAEEPEMGEPRSLAFSFCLYEPEIPVAFLTAGVLIPWVEEPDVRATRLEQLPLELARSMLDLRFAELAKEEDAPFLQASASRADAFDIFDGENLQIVCRPERWEEALAFGEQELRRAVLHGFQQAELDEVRADALRALDEAVEREPTADSRLLLGEILGAAEERHVPMDAASRRALLAPALEALTVEDCHRTLAERWAEGELSLYATGGLDLGEEAEERLREVWSRSLETEVAAGEEIVLGAFAYASDPEQAGEIVERSLVEDLDLHRVRFANGVTVNVKATDFEEKEIRVRASLGEGRLTVEPERAVVAWVGGQVLDQAGLEAHSLDDLRRLTAGRQVGVGFAVEEDVFTLDGSTTAEDLLLELELLCAGLEHPGWREDGLIQLRRQIPPYFEELEHQPQGPLMTAFLPALYSGDARFGIPPRESIEAVDMEALRAWLAEHLREAPLELTLVGDLDVEAVVAAAARTFGRLGERRALRAYDERRVVPAALEGFRQVHEIDTEVPRSLVYMVFPTTDGIEAARRRSLYFLSVILDDRIRVDVRERLGAAYSPGAAAETSRVLPGHGSILIQAMSQPAGVETLVEACLEVADSLAKEGVTAEEVERLRDPIINTLRDARRTNSFWLSLIDEAQRRPESLDDVRTLDAFYEEIEAGDLTPLAEEYLGRERASILVVNPK